MSWYECRIKCDYVAPIFRYCQKTEDGKVTFFDGGLGWFRCKPETARDIAELKGPSLFQAEIEESYRRAV